MGDYLKKSMISALTWNSVNVFGLQAVQLIIGIILARLLSPEMFGEIGVLFIFIGLGTILTDGGFGQGLIRKQDAVNKDFSTIFFFNLALSIVLYLLLFWTSPAIVSFFSLPHIVTPARVLFASVILYSFYIIQFAKLTKELNYRALALINISSVLLSGVLAIFAAFKGFGVWALVIQQLFFHFFRTIITPFFSRWKPQLVFTFSTIKSLWKFSIALLGQTTLNVIFANIYVVLIGRFYPIRQVGYFTQANKYSETVNAATQGILSSSTFPIFSKIQDNTERLKQMYRKLTTSVIMISFPAVAFLIIAAEPLIVTLISEKWLPSVILFQILVFAHLLNPVYLINVNLLNARGESKNVLNLEIFKKTLIVLSIFICFKFGINALLIGLAVSNFISFGVSMFLVKRSVAHYLRHQILDVLPVLIMVSICASMIYPLQFLISSYLLQLIIMGITFSAIYIAAVRIFYPTKFKEGLMVLRKRMKK